MAVENPQWYVLYTKPRSEKKVAARLTEAGFEVYCPLRKVRKQWSDRIKVVEEPLFSSYIFIRTHDHLRDEVFRYPGTVRYLFWLKKPAVVREVEINAIRKWLGTYDHEAISLDTLEPGDRIRITAGQFMEEEGTFIEKSGSTALIQLDQMGLKLSVNLLHNPILKR